SMPGNGLATNQQPMLCSSPSLQLDLKQQQQQQLPLSHVEVEPSTEPEPSAAFPNSQLQLLSGAAIWPPSASSSASLRDSWSSSAGSNGSGPAMASLAVSPLGNPQQQQQSQSLPMLQHLQQMNQQMMQLGSINNCNPASSVYSLCGNVAGQPIAGGPLQQQQQQQRGGTGAFWQGIVGCFRPMWNAVGRTAAVPASKQPQQRQQAADWCADESEVVELGFLASGSQGSVTLVLHRGQQVALKRFNDPDAALLVPLKELSHLGRLSHPHVVKFLACLDGGGGPGLLMEFCPHGNLFDYYTVGTDCLPAARIADWSRQLASGMAYLHECRIPHGDLKSPNILLCELDRLKISDFGLVPPNRGDEAGSGHRQQQQQQLYGTMRWMSPEQCRQEAWSYPADVYSYGVILWELLFMEVPYKCVDPWAVMLGVGQGSLCLPVPGHTPGLLGSLMQTCWSTEPSQRPTFRGIVTALAASGLPDLLVLTDGDLRVLRKVWSAEISRAMSSRVRREDFKAKLEADLLRRRRDELHHAADIRLLYEKRLRRLDELQMSLTNSQIRQQLRDRAEAQRSDRLREAVRDRCCRRCRRALRGLVGEGGDAVKEDNDSGDCRMADNCAKTSAAAASRGSGVVLDRPIRAAISLDCLAAAAAASASSAATEAAAATAAATNAAEEAESPSSPGRGIGDRGQPFRRAYRRRAPPAVAPQQQPTGAASSGQRGRAAAQAASRPSQRRIGSFDFLGVDIIPVDVHGGRFGAAPAQHRPAHPGAAGAPGRRSAQRVRGATWWTRVRSALGSGSLGPLRSGRAD
ncbi:hypothetical protein BOX15_Mlig014380g3, partial [Macrostomum lignano]